MQFFQSDFHLSSYPTILVYVQPRWLPLTNYAETLSPHLQLIWWHDSTFLVLQFQFTYTPPPLILTIVTEKERKAGNYFFFQFIFFRGFVRDFKLWDLMTLFYKAQNFTTDQLLSTYAKFLKRHCVSGNTKCLFFGKFFVRAKWEIP